MKKNLYSLKKNRLNVMRSQLVWMFLFAVSLFGGENTFATPVATTNVATAITATTVTLNATVNDNGTAITTIQFQYGTLPALTSGSIHAGSPSSLAAGSGATAVTANLTGLTPNTTYYFRITATGASLGSILSFTTPSLPTEAALSFANATGTLVVCKNSGQTFLVDSLLKVNDSSTTDTIIWSQSSGPLHGTLHASDTAIANGGTVTPPHINYMPTAGYSGNDTFTIAATNGATTITKTIFVTINSIVSSIVTQNNVSCNGGSNGSVTIAATGGTVPYAYSWSPNGGTTATTSGLAAGNYLCTITDNYGCTDTQNVTMTQPDMVTASISGSTAICNNTNTAIIINSAAGVVVGYSVNNGAIQYAAIDANGADTINTGALTANAIFSLSDVSSGACTYPATDSATVSVYPVPDVDTINDQSVCNGAITTSVILNGNVPGTVFYWSNDNTSVGFSANGTDSILSFVGINDGSSVATSNITITPVANGCTGNTQHFSIMVKPTPNVAIPADQTVCSGIASTEVMFDGTVNSTTYTWANNNTNIGLIAADSGNISSFTATNNADTAITGTITVTPTAAGCVGAPQTFAIIVNPTPNVVAPANQVACNTVGTTTAINFSGAVDGTTYAWINSDTSIGIGASGSGDIQSFNGSNSTNAPVTSTITVTPTAAGCVGPSQSFTITIIPTPGVILPANQVVCNNTAVDSLSFTSLTSGTTYTWTNSDTSIGLTTTGNGNIASFTGINATNVPVASIITVTPTADGCVGSPTSFTVTVNPTPNMDMPVSDTACNHSSIAEVFFNGPVDGTTYSWINADTSIGLAATGTGNIQSFTGANLTVATVTDTVVVIPSANGCAGGARPFTITIYPTPKLTTAHTDTLCSGVPFNYTPNSATAGVTYTWSRATANHIIEPGVTGTASISEKLINDTLAPVNATYIYTLTANSCSNKEDVVLTLNPAPPIPGITTHPSPDICSNVMYQNFGVASAPSPGEEYVWTATNAAVYATGADKQYAIVNFPAAGTSNVIITANMAGIACYSSDTFAVNVGDSAAIVPDMVYHNGHFVCLQNNMSSYQWGYDNNTTMDSTLLAGEIDQDYYNPDPDFIHNNYWVMTIQNGCMQKTYYNTPTTVANVTAATGDDIKVYPNPASQYINVAVATNGAAYTEVKVLDVLGKVHATIPMMDNKATVNISSLASGMYMINCYQDGAPVKTARFIKN